jgi:hypothetical protein
MIIGWSGEAIFDVLIFSMTLYKTLTLPSSGGVGLLTMFLRDGVSPTALWRYVLTDYSSSGTLYFAYVSVSMGLSVQT